MLRVAKKIGVGLATAVGISVLNLLIVLGVCWLKDSRNHIAYSNGLFYTELGYVFLSIVMMAGNGASFHGALIGRGWMFHPGKESFAEAREGLQSTFSGFNLLAVLLIAGVITCGLATFF
ncbi:hypothetical protein CEB3_c19880 [Peptococcaceae bacterium CEB3]|nr:hypothetical protein CEB3_c19880 [Peptococcaceae bacterium CEB3]